MRSDRQIPAQHQRPPCPAPRAALGSNARHGFFRCFGAWVVAIAAWGAMLGDVVAQEEGATIAPGLAVEYWQRDVRVAQDSAYAPQFWLEAGETLDPRLTTEGWRATYRGWIEVTTEGEYTFHAAVSGDLKLRVSGEALLERAGPTGETASRPVALAIGQHPIEIDYRPTGEPARLRLEWSTAKSPREPLTGRVLRRDGAVEKPDDDANRGELDIRPRESVRGLKFLGLTDEHARGWLSVEEHGCAACHRPRDEVTARDHKPRPGPRLTSARGRLRRDWIVQWLNDPSAVRPGAVMPRLFGDDRPAEVERVAVASYFMSLGSDEELPSVAAEASPAETEAASNGPAVFDRVGCAACHGATGFPVAIPIAPTRPVVAPLGDLRAKTSLKPLTDYLRDPLIIDPSGRMPRVSLSDEETHALAAWLLLPAVRAAPRPPSPAPPTRAELLDAARRLGADAATLARWEMVAPDALTIELGRRVVAAKRCGACHELPEDGAREAWKPAVAALESLSAKSSEGCQRVAENGTGESAPPLPRYSWQLDRTAIAAFLNAIAERPPSPAPLFHARLTLARFACTACHEADGHGGLDAQLAAKLTAEQTEANAEAIAPPPLTMVGEKLTASALNGVLVEGQRSRPWMALRMPQFPRDALAALPRQWACAAGISGAAASDHMNRSDGGAKPSAAPASDELLDAGRTLVGGRGFGCIKCHDFGGVASSGTRGPDLGRVPTRVRRAWYERWMIDPQRIQPGTRMPTVFVAGESPQAEILAGDPARQREAIWQYLTASHALPAPEGIERPSPQRLALGGRPIVVRTFLAGMSARSMAIGFDNDVHLLFDAQACRVAGMFRGGFLDMSAPWSGRGGSPAKLEGTPCWQAPAGFPWALTDAGQSPPPDLHARVDDPRFGALPSPAPPVVDSRVRFQGYALGTPGPTFRYRLELEDKAAAEFAEQVSTTRNDLGVAALRAITARWPNGQAVWLHLASDESPSPALADGSSATQVLRVVQGGRSLLLHVRGGEANWRYGEWDGRRQVFLRWEPARGASEAQATATVVVWSPNDERAATLELLEQFERSVGGEAGQ